MSRNRNESACLIDRLVGPPELGPPRAVLATTFELTSDFVEHDFLPSLLSLTNRDDRSTRARLQLEEHLAKMNVAAVLMDAECYRSRPCSLRVHLTARQARDAGRLHAKVTVVVHDDAVRLLVGSANLTDGGYRSNREVAIALCATAKKPAAASLIAQALEPIPEMLGAWWNAEAEKVRRSALDLLAAWPVPAGDEDDSARFSWSGSGRPLWREFTAQWPRGEPLKKLFVVSPFWSAEHEQGQLDGLLRALRERGAATDGAQVVFLSNAVAEKEGTFLPQAHPSFATYDFRGLGVQASLQAVDPRVDEEGFEKDGRLRQLHAKIAIAVGATTTLAYVGSANFTKRGWGFGDRARLNIEAGVLLKREGKAGRALLALLPATTGEPQKLDGSGRLLFGPLTADTQGVEWPAFIAGAELGPDGVDGERLVLIVHLLTAGLPAHLSIGASAQAASSLWQGDPRGQKWIQVALTSDALRALLVQKEIFLRWSGLKSADPLAFPLNVAADAREQLPFSKPGELIGESELVAFYQGKISFEDLFPQDADEGASGGESEPLEAAVSEVDTTKILSYQIREFVEALPGIRQELERTGGTVSSIRLALLGPVSPVALGRSVEAAVRQGRSATAGAFQLLELVLCLRRVDALKQPEGALRIAWVEARNEAEQKLLAAYERVVRATPAVAETPSFQYYRRLLVDLGGAN